MRMSPVVMQQLLHKDFLIKIITFILLICCSLEWFELSVFINGGRERQKIYFFHKWENIIICVGMSVFAVHAIFYFLKKHI